MYKYILYGIRMNRKGVKGSFLYAHIPIHIFSYWSCIRMPQKTSFTKQNLLCSLPLHTHKTTLHWIEYKHFYTKKRSLYIIFTQQKKQTIRKISQYRECSVKREEGRELSCSVLFYSSSYITFTHTFFSLVIIPWSAAPHYYLLQLAIFTLEFIILLR